MIVTRMPLLEIVSNRELVPAWTSAPTGTKVAAAATAAIRSFLIIYLSLVSENGYNRK